MDWNLVVSTIALLTALIGGLIAAVWKIGKWVNGVNQRLDALGKWVNGVNQTLDALLLIHRRELLQEYGRLAPPPPSNPYTAEERAYLLDRLNEGTISHEEARRLEGILTEERRDAEAQNNFVLALLIDGLLTLVALYLRQRAHDRSA